MDAFMSLPCSYTIQRACLGELSDYWLETECPCGSAGSGAVRELIKTHGSGIIVGDLVRRLRCRECHGPLAIYLMHGPYREPENGHSPYWALALHRSPPSQARPRIA